MENRDKYGNVKRDEIKIRRQTTRLNKKMRASHGKKGQK
jgi:hypothetical protein